MECGISVNGQASAVHHCQPTRITRQQSHANWPLVGLVQAGLGFRRVGGSGGSGVQEAAPRFRRVGGSGGSGVQAGGRFRRVWGSGGWTVQAAPWFRRPRGSGGSGVQAAPWFRRVWGSGGPLVQAVQACPKEIEGGLHGVVGSNQRGVGE